MKSVISNRQSAPMSGRFLFLLFIGICVISICLARLFDLMVIQGSFFRERADANRFFTIPILANRGVILDRDGTLLVHNIPEFYVASSSAQRLFGSSWSLSKVADGDIGKFMIASSSSLFLRAKRSLDTPLSLSHVVGYTGFADTFDPEASRMDVRVGKTGVEKKYDSLLRGTDGEELIEISAKGTIQRTIMTTKESVDGQNIKLSIDSKLSNVAYQAVAPNPGAVIVTDIPTGQVLVLVSSPSYSNATVSAVLQDKSKPLLNRALTSYPPGSTFKIMTALTALHAKKITPETTVRDDGELKIGTQVFGNWYWRQYGRTEGVIALTKAIARSNDIYFYKTAESVGPDLIDATASEFGFGKSTAIDLPAESIGVLPNSAWKEKKVGEKWYLGDTYNMGIGQGYILATPIQVNNMTAAVARRGSWCPLTLQLLKDPACTDTDLEKKDLESVISGMVGACSTGGTAFPFFPINEKLSDTQKVACKTGTAEFGAEDSQGRKKTHGWFTMFYPVEKPKVAITVFLESTQEHPFLEGSKDGGPIAVKVFEAWREKYDK